MISYYNSNTFPYKKTQLNDNFLTDSNCEKLRKIMKLDKLRNWTDNEVHNHFLNF